ncbi:MAG TPA: integration host factor subunit alpha [Gammaproteobacteria bacterium]|nr:integration host factor subunit alpha [Gammaproteobacteria bacterium]
MTLTKAEIAEGLQQKFGLTKSVAKEIVDQVFEEMRLSLEAGRPIKLSGLGNFDLHDKKARPGRNPKTGEPKVIAARRVVTFKAGQKLKTKIEKIEK